MLANKAKLGYSATESGTATDLPGLKQLPELGAEPTMVDNTCLTDTIITNEMGIGDPGSLEYVFKFVNSAATDSYRILKALDSATTYYWTQEMADGTKFKFPAQPSIRVGGGGVNEAIEFTLSLALQGDITVTNPPTV